MISLLYDEHKLPIESDLELLTEYGRTFAWINSVEYLLEAQIIFKGKLHLIDRKLRVKLIERKTLGQKIDLAVGLLEPELIEDLRLLNKNRTLIAHNATAQQIYTSERNETKGEYVISGKSYQESIPLTKEFLSGIIGLAQSLSAKLLSEFGREESQA